MSLENEKGLILLKDIENKNLLRALILQLNRDLSLSGIDDPLKLDSSPELAINQLNRIILKLIQNDFDAYLNLLYRIDVAEHQVRSIRHTDPLIISEKVAEMILKRVWQKVWFRNKIL